MTAAVIVAVVASIGAVVCAVGWWQAGRMPAVHRRLRRQVIVTLKSGTTFAGVLYEADRSGLVLRNTEAISQSGNRTSVDGEVLVLTGDVDFVQLT